MRKEFNTASTPTDQKGLFTYLQARRPDRPVFVQLPCDLSRCQRQALRRSVPLCFGRNPSLLWLVGRCFVQDAVVQQAVVMMTAEMNIKGHTILMPLSVSSKKSPRTKSGVFSLDVAFFFYSFIMMNAIFGLVLFPFFLRAEGEKRWR